MKLTIEAIKKVREIVLSLTDSGYEGATNVDEVLGKIGKTEVPASEDRVRVAIYRPLEPKMVDAEKNPPDTSELSYIEFERYGHQDLWNVKGEKGKQTVNA